MRLLVIEDEATMVESLRRGLTAEGFAVDTAMTGSDGLWMAREFPYDLILLDIMLPEVNGYEICRTLRREEVWTPILMLTAKQGDLDEAEGLELGADDYLTKPFSFVVLVARIRALLRRRAGDAPTKLVAGDLVLDPAERSVSRGEVEVEITAREFAVLEQLMRRPGEVLSKQEIIDKVWDLNFDGDVNIVEVYVSSLRKKVDGPFGRKAIETVRGVGYRVRGDGG